MARKSTTYSFEHVVCTIDGLRAFGFWEGDDAAQVAPGGDAGAGMVGADGSSIFSVSANRSAQITLRFQHSSPSHSQLMRLHAVQQASGRGGFPLDLKDTGSGEGGNTDQAFIMTPPDDAKGEKAGVREWVLWTGDWNREIPRNA